MQWQASYTFPGVILYNVFEECKIRMSSTKLAKNSPERPAWRRAAFKLQCIRNCHAFYSFYRAAVCRRSFLRQRCLSVRLSVCLSVSLSVRHTRELWQNERKFHRDSYTGSGETWWNTGQGTVYEVQPHRVSYPVTDSWRQRCNYLPLSQFTPVNPGLHSHLKWRPSW